MAIKLVREFQQKQQIAITPQLKKSIDLLQLSRVEIINKINEEAEDNPFLIKESEADVCEKGEFQDVRGGLLGSGVERERVRENDR